jgi:hypothetical protein
LVLQAFVRQAVESLQDEHFEHEHAACWLAPSLALAYLAVHALKDWAKYFPIDDGVESLQWITRFAQAGVSVLKVKEAVLHRVSGLFGAQIP